jgi:hypothetical protein
MYNWILKQILKQNKIREEKKETIKQTPLRMHLTCALKLTGFPSAPRPAMSFFGFMPQKMIPSSYRIALESEQRQAQTTRKTRQKAIELTYPVTESKRLYFSCA